MRAGLVLLLFGAACRLGSPLQDPSQAHEVHTCSVGPLQLIPMNDSMRGEERGEVFDTAVRYLDEAERRQRLLVLEDGTIADSTGVAWDTRGKWAIFVLSPSGELYGSTEAKRGEFHHSSFLAGGPVAGAGEIIVDSGTVVEVAGYSGHYRPNYAMTMQFLCWLSAHDVALDQVRFYGPKDDGPYPAAELITPVP